MIYIKTKTREHGHIVTNDTYNLVWYTQATISGIVVLMAKDAIQSISDYFQVINVLFPSVQVPCQ